MKKIIVSLLLLSIVISCFSKTNKKEIKVKFNKKGIISSVEFPESMTSEKIPKTSKDFFKHFIKTKPEDSFTVIPRKSKNKDLKHEHFDQYYKGVKVAGAGYNFHYKKGKMYFAHGRYIKIENLNIMPALSTVTAVNNFAQYKNIPINTITDYEAELIIKVIITNDSNNPVSTPTLVYKIYFNTYHENNNEIGYIDAQTGKLIQTEPIHSGFSRTGTFDTRYSGEREGTTDSISDGHRLYDVARKIHTWNLDGSVYINQGDELLDNDNDWTSEEYHDNEDDMALDVHWALQKIWDRLDDYGINSYDDLGSPINAYVHYGELSDRNKSSWGWTC